MSELRSLFRVEVIAEWLEREGFWVKDLGLLASALERPWLQFGGRELYPDVWLKAAALLDSIEGSHPFHDGNKRAGVLLLSLFLAAHGVDDEAISDDDLFHLVCDVATSHPDVDVLASRIKALAGH